MSQIVRLIVGKDGKLGYKTVRDRNKYNSFIKRLKDGDVIDMYIELVTDDATLTQLAKVHAIIGRLASATGNTFDGMKMMVKKRAGLCFIHTVDGDKVLECKSFGDDCSKDELGLAIQAAIELGEELGVIVE